MLIDLTKSEMEIICTMWLQKRPLTRAEIINLSENRTWKASSIHILLNSMLDKGAICISGFEKTGSHYGRTYAPVVSEEQYAAMQVRMLPSYKVNKVETVKNVLSALVDGDDMDAQTLEELTKMLEEHNN